MAELFYALFILSGLIKFFIRQKAPGLDVIDFTLVTAILVAAVLLWEIYRNFFIRNRFYIAPHSRAALGLSAGFYLWMIATLSFTASPSFSYTKTFLFLTALLGFLFPLLHRHFNPQRFMRWFLYISSLFILLFIVFLKDIAVSGALDSDKEFMAKYLDIGLFAGLNLIVLILFPVVLKPPVKLALSGVALAALITSGGRGPIVILAIVFAIKLLVGIPHYWQYIRRLTLKRLIAVILALVVLGIGMIYVMEKYADSLERTVMRMSLLGDAASGSISKRFDYIRFTIDKATASVPRFLFGYGAGSFGILFNHEDGRDYPHNIILETWFEMGFLGALLFVAFFAVSFRHLWGGGSFYIFLYLFINSMKSQSLTDLRIMFGIMAVLWILQNHMEETSLSHETP